MKEVLQKVKEAQKKIATLKGKDKDKILLEMADALEKEAKTIIEENKKDLDYAKDYIVMDHHGKFKITDNNSKIVITIPIKRIENY